MRRARLGHFIELMPHVYYCMDFYEILKFLKLTNYYLTLGHAYNTNHFAKFYLDL